MSIDSHANFAYTSVTVAPSPAASGTSLTVTDATVFPAVPFNATIWPANAQPLKTNAEIVRVTNIAGNVLTITRTQEGTSARTILVGDQIDNAITVKVFTDIETSFAGTNGAITGGSITVNSSGVSVNVTGLKAASLSGNTAGALALISSGTIILAGGNNVTLSQNGQSITISGAAAGGAQTAISGIVGSNATYTSGTVTLTGVGGGVTVSSNTGQRIDISVAAPVAQTVQTQNVHNVTLSGNTAGVLAAISSGTWTLAGGNNITLSQAGNAVTISGAAAGGAQTAISGVAASNTTYTSGTVSFTGVGGGITVSSNTGQRVDLSVATPTPIGTAVKAVASIGSTGTITRYAPEDHQHAGVAAFAVTNTGNTAGNTRSQVGTLFLAASGNITASQSTAAAGNDTVWLSVATQTVQTQNLHNVTLSGNTAGALAAISSGTWTLAGGNNITLSQAGNAVTISGANAGGAQTAISGIVVSDTTYTSGTVSFSNAGNITISSSVNAGTQYIRLSVATGLTNIRVSAGTTSNLLSALTFADGNGFSFGLNASTITISASTADTATTVKAVASANSVGTVNRWVAEDHAHAGIGAVGISTSGNTAGTTGSVQGTYWFQGGNNLTVSQITSNNGSHTLVLSAGAGGAAVSVSDAATSGTVGRLAFTNLNGVTLSLSTGAGGSHTIVGSHNALTSQSTQFLALTLGGNTAGTTTFHATNNASLFLHGGANITLSGNGSSVTISGAAGGGAAVSVSDAASSGTIGRLAFTNLNGITLSLSTGAGGSHTIVASGATVNTVGTATTVYPVASANSVGTVTRWAAEDHRHAGIGGIGVSTSGNEAGTTGSNVGTYWFEGGNNVTVSQITSNNGSHTLVLSGAAQGTVSMWPYPVPQTATSVSTYYSGSTSQGAGGASTQTGYTFSLYCVPMPIPNLAFSELRLGVSNSRSTAGTGSATHIYSLGLYTNNASTLSLVKAYYGGIYFSQNSITAQSFSVWTATTGTQSSQSAGFGGIRAVSIYSSGGNISANSQMEPGVKWIRVDDGTATTLTLNQYYCVLGFASVSSSVNVYANVGILQSNIISSGPMSDLGRENSTQTSNYLPAWGAISTTYTSISNALGFFPLPNAIPIANMTMSNSSGMRYHFPMMRNHS